MHILICCSIVISFYRLLSIKKLTFNESMTSHVHQTQSHKGANTVHAKENSQAITFANLVMQGKIKSAIRLLDDASGGSILCATDLCKDGKMTVCDCLGAKHPPGQPVVPSQVVSTSRKSEFPQPIIFEPLTDALIKSIAMSIEDAAGPSWADAIDWR